MKKIDLIQKLKQLEGITQDERAYLINLVNTKKKYGLVWEDKPEDVEELLRENLPVLKEVKDKAIFASVAKKKSDTLFDDEEQSNTIAPNHILIEGDNLHALTALTFTHENKIDVIYIDPPYNTGNKDFKYNDTFIDREDSFRHSKWLSFMHKRLQIAKRLLSNKGVIFISIDDNEQAQLKLLCDDVFLEENFIGELVWEKGKKSDSKFFSVTHEYIITYVKSKSFLIEQNVRWRKKKDGLDEVLEKYETFKNTHAGNHELVKKEMMKWYNGLPKNDVKRKHKHYNYSDDRGLYFAADFAGPDDGRLNRPRYDIFHPITGKSCVKPSTGWRWDEETTKKALLQNPPRIHFGKDETTIPCRKTYLFEIDSEPLQSVFYKDGRTATLQVEELIGKGKFNFPKDTEILANLIALNGHKDSLILDFFAGSGSTLHATMHLNAEDGGNRQCILVTNNENNICEEVTYERNKRVIQGYASAKGVEVEGLTNNNLRYYQNQFVGRESSLKNKRELTRLATELLCIKEDCYTEQKINIKQAKLFSNAAVTVLILFDDHIIPDVVELIKGIDAKEIKVYVFSMGSDPYTEDFTDVLDKITLCALPDAIYKAYQNVLPKKKRTVPLMEEASEIPTNENGEQLSIL